jgi:hypothetical protein
MSPRFALQSYAFLWGCKEKQFSEGRIFYLFKK